MRVRSWLATCATSICATATRDSTVSLPNNNNQSPSSFNHLASDTSSSSNVPGSATSSSLSSDASSVNLHSNLSIQTLTSVPSLQKLTPEPLNISHLCVKTLKPRPQHPISCLALHDNILYSASDHEINAHNLTSFTHLDAFNNHQSSSGSVKSVSFCEGKVFTAHQDCKIRVWKMTPTPSKKHKLLTALPTVNDRLRRFVLPKNYVTVRRHKKLLWIEHADAVTGLAVNNGLIYSVSWDKSLKIWRASDLRCLHSIKAHEDAINTVAVSGDGTVYTGSADRTIRVWAKTCNEKRHVLVATLEKHKSAVNALALNDDGSVLFSGACDRSILVWEREDSANHMVVTGALRGHDKAILSLINVSDLLLSGSADRTVRIWQTGHDAKYCCLAVLEGHEKPVKSLAATREEGSNGVVSVFSGALDGEIKVWQVSVSRPGAPDFLKLNW